MKTIKVVYKDSGKTRVLRGILNHEDLNFIEIDSENCFYRINKQDVILLRTDKEDEAKEVEPKPEEVLKKPVKEAVVEDKSAAGEVTSEKKAEGKPELVEEKEEEKK